MDRDPTGVPPLGLPVHPPALPPRVWGRSTVGAMAPTGPTLPDHGRGGAHVRRLACGYPPSRLLNSRLAHDTQWRPQKKNSVVGYVALRRDTSGLAYCQQLFCRGLLGVLFLCTMPRVRWFLVPGPCSDLTSRAARGRRGARERRGEEGRRCEGEKRVLDAARGTFSLHHAACPVVPRPWSVLCGTVHKKGSWTQPATK